MRSYNGVTGALMLVQRVREVVSQQEMKEQSKLRQVAVNTAWVAVCTVVGNVRAGLPHCPSSLDTVPINEPRGVVIAIRHAEDTPVAALPVRP